MNSLLAHFEDISFKFRKSCFYNQDGKWISSGKVELGFIFKRAKRGEKMFFGVSEIAKYFARTLRQIKEVIEGKRKPNNAKAIDTYSNFGLTELKKILFFLSL